MNNLLNNIIKQYAKNFLKENNEKEITQNTIKAIDYIVNNTNYGFKKQTNKTRLGNVNKISADDFKTILKKLFQLEDKDIVVWGPKSGPNPSSKFDLYELNTEMFGKIKFVLSGGANAGEKYEKDFLKMAQAMAGEPHENLPLPLQQLYKELNIDNEKLKSFNVKFEGTESTKRSLSLAGPKNVGQIVSDITINYLNKNYYISLKNKNGNTIYNGKNIPFIEEKNNLIVYNSAKDSDNLIFDFLFNMFNIDRQKLADQLMNYMNKTGEPSQWQSIQINKEQFKLLLASSFGYGYYYVQEKNKGVKVVPLLTEQDALDAIGDIKNVEIKYPSINTKQLTIKIETFSSLFGNVKYLVTVRNKSGKIVPLSLNISKA
jgi:hypothetical protein